MPIARDLLHQPVLAFLRHDLIRLRDDWTVSQALDAVRHCGPGGKIIYFYVVDADGRLIGVVPTRGLLCAPLESLVGSIMSGPVTSLPESSTVMQAVEALVARKLMALPVVDSGQRLIGALDLGALTDAVGNVAERERMDELFEAIGVRVAEVKDASPWRAFRFRFPWLLATIASGTICALLAGMFELTLAKSLVLAFFLTLVLGLGESVSIQSMTVAIQALRATPPCWSWYARALRREAGAALLLGLACGAVVTLIVLGWRGDAAAAASIGASIFFSLCSACFFGLTVPSLLHAMRWDPKIAAGPVTLAITDIFTLLFYFGLATLLL